MRDGALRYLLAMLDHDLTRRDGAPVTAVLLHPHPAMGGNRFHPIVDALYHGLEISTLRFDLTSSAVDVAQGELHDAMRLAPDDRVVLMGYSFGADIALTSDDAEVLGWFAVAPPLRIVEPTRMAAAHDPRPKRLVIPELDQYSSPARATEVTTGWLATSVAVVPGADHFLVGHAAPVLEEARQWLAALGVS